MTKILLDTNVLLLFIFGNVAPDFANWKLLADYDNDDLQRVNRAAKSAQHVTLPNILSEASNHLGEHSPGGMTEAFGLLFKFAKVAQEIYKPSLDAMADPIYSRLGLTDAAIALLGREKIRVVTVDFELSNRLAHDGVDVENLRHYKTPRHRSPNRKSRG